MSPAVQSPILALLPDATTAEVVKLPKRRRELGAEHRAALAAARSPETAADLRETADLAAAEIAANPGAVRLICRRLILGGFVHGHMDKAAEDAVALDQADALADAALAQVVDLVAARQERAGA